MRQMEWDQRSKLEELERKQRQTRNDMDLRMRSLEGQQKAAEHQRNDQHSSQKKNSSNKEFVYAKLNDLERKLNQGKSLTAEESQWLIRAVRTLMK